MCTSATRLLCLQNGRNILVDVLQKCCGTPAELTQKRKKFATLLVIANTQWSTKPCFRQHETLARAVMANQNNIWFIRNRNSHPLQPPHGKPISDLISPSPWKLRKIMMPFTGASKWLGTAKMGVVYSNSYPPCITRFSGEISFSVRLESLRYLIMHSEKNIKHKRPKIIHWPSQRYNLLNTIISQKIHSNEYSM